MATAMATSAQAEGHTSTAAPATPVRIISHVTPFAEIPVGTSRRVT